MARTAKPDPPADYSKPPAGPLANDPSPEAIKAACERIQASWTPGETVAREMGLTWNHARGCRAEWSPPVIAEGECSA